MERMNDCVPDFEMDNDYSISTSSVLTRPKKSVMVEDDVMELLWQNGQVVFQRQNQRSFKKSSPSKFDDAVILADQSAPREIQSWHHQQEQQHQHQEHLFMQEDEMASWLHYPLNETNFDSDFCADLLYSAPCVTSATTMVTATAPVGATTQVAESQPPQNTSTAASAAAPASRSLIPPPSRTENFVHFSRHKPRTELSRPSYSKNVIVRESTMVDSSGTPAVGPESRVSEAMRSTEGASGVNNLRGNTSGDGAVGTSSAGGVGVGVGARDLATCEMTVTSSLGDSSASAEPPSLKPPAEDRKRKGRENDDECKSEDVELESVDIKKQTRGSTTTKRSRAAEIHNLSERRRRDRINEKMRALQELIPCCNKSDKASMLDDAIQYLKSLQLQVQMMSMGCGMVPMMFPGVQQYMPNMGMGIGMGMGMGMEMGMSQPMMLFPNVLPGSALPTPAAAAHLGPRLPMLAFPMPPVPDTSRVHAANKSDPRLNSYSMQNPNQLPHATNFADPYQQYLALRQMQLPLQQSQTMVQPSANKPSTSKGAKNPEKHPSGT